MMQNNMPPHATAKQTLLLVDDHPMLCEGLKQFLEQDQKLQVCGRAGDTAEALRLVDELKPDLIVVDIGLPGRDGLELIKDIRARNNTCRILVFSMFDEGLYAERALRAGAQGYLMKSETPQKLREAIHHILNGEMVTGNNVVQLALQRSAAGQTAAPASPLTLLTDRQLEIFRLIGAGKGRNEIAAQLHMSVKTFEVHRANIRQKLGLPCARELMMAAAQYVQEIKN